jgi:hypothetical protein
MLLKSRLVFLSVGGRADDRHDKGAMGIVTRTGGTIAFFGMSLWPISTEPTELTSSRYGILILLHPSYRIQHP